jgi:hypothetical protein
MPDDPTVLNPIRDAHARGVKVMLIPHLAYWRSRFDWRGAITFDTEEEWARFFSGYTGFIVTQARMAQQAGATCFYNAEGNGPEPLLTIWEPISANALLNYYENGKTSPRDFLKNADVHYVRIARHNALISVNTPEEFDALTQKKSNNIQKINPGN